MNTARTRSAFVKVALQRLTVLFRSRHIALRKKLAMLGAILRFGELKMGGKEKGKGKVNSREFWLIKVQGMLTAIEGRGRGKREEGGRKKIQKGKKVRGSFTTDFMRKRRIDNGGDEAWS